MEEQKSDELMNVKKLIAKSSLANQDSIITAINSIYFM
jgi:hypothetical protein